MPVETRKHIMNLLGLALMIDAMVIMHLASKQSSAKYTALGSILFLAGGYVATL